MSDLNTSIERLLSTTVVRSLLEAGYTIELWNGGDEAEYRGRDLDALLAEMMATDEDVLNVVLDDGKHITRGWVHLIYGNGIDVISDYTVNLEQYMAEADRVRGAIEEDLMMLVPVDDVREVLAVLEPLADEVRDPHLAKLISMFKGAVR